MTSRPVNSRHPDWVYREVDIGDDKSFWVPRYIYRISKAQRDSVGGGAKGWQVKYSTPSVFFSDYMACGLADEPNPEASLAMALAHLSSIWEGNKERAHKKHFTGIPGVSLRFRPVRTTGADSFQCEVRVYANGGRLLNSDYVGTSKTASLSSIAALVNAGRLIRNNYLVEEGLVNEVQESFDFNPFVALTGTPFEHLLADIEEGTPLRTYSSSPREVALNVSC